jgi:hypothetical protein
LAVDASGNLYVTEPLVGLVHKVDANGAINVVAGGGTNYPGDGGAATNVNLLGGHSISGPYGVAVDASGHLFIGEQGHDRIRQIALAGLSAFSVDNITELGAGNYDVVVTSPHGSVTSAVATLTVVTSTIPSPSIVMGIPSIAGGKLLLGFDLLQGSSPSFTLLQAPTTMGPWMTNATAILTTNDASEWFTVAVPGPSSVQFYKVRSP